MIDIRYIGSSGVRTIGEYTWDKGNNHICPVDLETAANLIAYPRPGQFEVVGGQKVTTATCKRLAETLGVAEADIKAMFAGEYEEAVPQLADIVPAGRIEELAANGVRSLTALAGLDEAGLKKLAGSTGASKKEIADWATQARAIIGGSD